MEKKLNHLNTRLVGILRTKTGTPAANAINAIQTAFDAGAEAVEVTSNSDHWQDILDECVKRNLNIGVGSIKNKKLAEEAVSHGAKFLVSPGFFEDAIEIANKNNISILPGVFTDPNFKQAIDLKIRDVKFFPANASTHEELFKAISEPFRDEFDELAKKGIEITYFDSFIYQNSRFRRPNIIFSPTQFYKLYLEAMSSRASGEDIKIVIKLPDEKQGPQRLKDFANGLFQHGIRTYAVGGVNDKNMKEVLTKYGAYGVCPGSGMFNSDAIFNGDFERVRTDVKRHVEVVKEVFSTKIS